MFKVGDRVKFKSGDYKSPHNKERTNKEIAGLFGLNFNTVYQVAEVKTLTGEGAIKLCDKNCLFFADRFELALTPEQTATQKFEEAMKAAWEEAPVSHLVTTFTPSHIEVILPTVTKIIHNGTTTITLFSDGSKMVTRPSPDDVAKYDPFVGWCVGVTAKLFGGKEKAKKFYKAHAVVQKGSETGPVKLYHCSDCRHLKDDGEFSDDCSECKKTSQKVKGNYEPK